MRRALALLLAAASASASAQASDACTSARPEPLLHPLRGGLRAHRFERLPRRMAVETLRMRDGFATTLLREGCESYAVTFDAGRMPVFVDAAHLRAAADAYMRRLAKADPHFWIARSYQQLRSPGVMAGRRLRLEDGNASFEIGADDSEPDRLLIVYVAAL
jgi:hypothetical protein